MEEENAKEKEFDQNGKKHKIGNIIKYVALYIAPIATAFFALYVILYNQQKDKQEEERADLDSQPQLEAEWGGEVPIGIEDYWRINLENKNENIITSGIFAVQYTVLLRTEMNVNETLVWENVFMESEIEYDGDLKGCFLFIKHDFFKHEEQIMEACRDKGIEVIECKSYAFCCFQYIEAGQEKTVYYLISLKPYEKCKVTEVKNPDEYMKGFLMDS